MNEERFVRERMAGWEELRDLLRRAEIRGLRSLDGAAVRRVGALYRSATSDLATARTLDLSEDTLRYLNRLCSVAHDQIYSRRSTSPRGRLVRFLSIGFPVLVARTWRYHASMMAVGLISGFVAFAVFRDDPDLLRRTMGPQMYDRAERALAMQDDARRYLEIESLYAMPFLSFGIIARNIQVTLLAFAAGIPLALPTVLLIIFNGVSIAGGVAVYHEVGVPELIWTFMAAHGPIELTAIFIAAGAGTRIGLSLLLPGRKTRAAALRDTTLDSIALLGGTALMLLVAGTIEGFISPSLLPPAAKFGVGGITLLAMVWYFGRGFAAQRAGVVAGRS